MLKSRIIPCLLIDNKGLVKTVRFKDPKYVGDPLNAVRIFNEKKVDEIMVLDISATREGREPDYALIEKIASECRMPLCYGGGISSLKQARRILALGVEKISLSSQAIANPSMITDIAQQVGNQSVVVTIDLKKKKLGSGYDIYTHNGKKKQKLKLTDFVQHVQALGVGEIVINSIDRDGTMAGYDEQLIDQVCKMTRVPLTVLGGAGSLDDIAKLVARQKIIGAAAGSLFVFKGKFRAVLINYPSKVEKDKLLNRVYDTV